MAQLPFRLLRADLEWPGLAKTSIPSQWPAHLWQKAGGGSAMEMLGCTSAYIKRNVVILFWRERQVTWNKAPWILEPCPSPFLCPSHVFLFPRKKKERQKFQFGYHGPKYLYETHLVKGEEEKWILGWTKLKMHEAGEMGRLFFLLSFNSRTQD